MDCSIREHMVPLDWSQDFLLVIGFLMITGFLIIRENWGCCLHSESHWILWGGSWHCHIWWYKSEKTSATLELRNLRDDGFSHVTRQRRLAHWAKPSGNQTNETGSRGRKLQIPIMDLWPIAKLKTVAAIIFFLCVSFISINHFPFHYLSFAPSGFFGGMITFTIQPHRLLYIKTGLWLGRKKNEY